jgi:hypothetical protein
MSIEVLDVSITEINGAVIDSVVFDINGHNVQINKYDDSPNVVVFIDGKTAKQMNILEIDDYIRSRT